MMLTSFLQTFMKMIRFKDKTEAEMTEGHVRHNPEPPSFRPNGEIRQKTEMKRHRIDMHETPRITYIPMAFNLVSTCRQHDETILYLV